MENSDRQNRKCCNRDTYCQRQPTLVGLPNSIQPLSFWFAGDAELDIIAHRKSLWSTSQSGEVEEHLPRSLTALDEAKLRPHGDDLQAKANHLYVSVFLYFPVLKPNT